MALCIYTFFDDNPMGRFGGAIHKTAKELQFYRQYTKPVKCGLSVVFVILATILLIDLAIKDEAVQYRKQYSAIKTAIKSNQILCHDVNDELLEWFSRNHINIQNDKKYNFLSTETEMYRKNTIFQRDYCVLITDVYKIVNMIFYFFIIKPSADIKEKTK